jgi:hypothetical protein
MATGFFRTCTTLASRCSRIPLKRTGHIFQKFLRQVLPSALRTIRSGLLMPESKWINLLSLT